MTKTLRDFLRDLTPEQAKELIMQVSQVMYNDYGISEADIKAFWNTFKIGVVISAHNMNEKISYESVAYMRI